MSNQNALHVGTMVKNHTPTRNHGETYTVGNVVTKSNKFKALQYAAPFLIPPEHRRDIENRAFAQKNIGYG